MSTDPSPPEDASCDPAAGRALLETARAEYREGSVARAWEAARRAAAIGRRIGDAALMADAATVIAGASVGAWELTAQRHALCREALALLGDGDPDRAGRLRALLAVTRSPWQNRANADPGPDPAADAERRSWELHARHASAAGAAGVRQRLAAADELAALAATAGRDEDAGWASLWRLDAYSHLGQRVELNAEMMALAATVRRLGSPAWRWRLAAARAAVALLDGHVADVPALTATALRLGVEAGMEDAPFTDLVVRSSLAVQTRTGLEPVEPEVRRVLAGAPFFAHGWHARVLLAIGRGAEALAIWRALAARLDDFPAASPEWLVATAGHVELCVAARDDAAAASLTEQLAPHADLHVGGIPTPYEGPVSLYLGKLALTLGRFTAARAHLTDAVAAAERMHAPLFAAAARDVLDSLADTGGPLSLRELDVARLVADGLTNRQIAERLFLSERTVENHVSSILRKLDVNTRSAIAARMSRPDRLFP